MICAILPKIKLNNLLALDNQDLQRLIERGEGDELDFKHSITSAFKIAIAITAFANRRGGMLLVGVKDNGKIAKINVEEEIYMLEAALDKCKPSIAYNIQELQLEGKSVIAMHIEEGKEKPYVSLDQEGKWLAYVRVTDSNVLANWVWLQVIKQKHKMLNIKLEYHGLDEIVLKFISENAMSTQRSIAKGLKANYRKVGNTLVKLVGMGIVNMEITKDGTFFSIAD